MENEEILDGINKNQTLTRVPDNMTMPTEVDHEHLEVVPNHAHGILKRPQPVLSKHNMEHPTLQGLQSSGDL